MHTRHQSLHITQHRVFLNRIPDVFLAIRSHCFAYLFFQFLAHDTDSSGTLKSRDFEVESDVLLPIEVPQVSIDQYMKSNWCRPCVVVVL